MKQPPYTLIFVTAAVCLCAMYFVKTTIENEHDNEDMTVSLCQIRVRFDGSDSFDDRPVLSLLATLKMLDFYIGQPVWGPSDTLLYLCEHRLKSGFKQSTINQELNNAIKSGAFSSARLAWSCA